MHLYCCKVVETSDSMKSGSISVQHPDLNGNQPMTVGYASPFGGSDYGFFAIPGKGTNVLVMQADVHDGSKKYFWFASPYMPGTVTERTTITTPHRNNNSDKPRKPVPGETYGTVSETTTKVNHGNPDPEATYQENDYPERYLFKSPKGHLLEFAEKITEKTSHNYAKLESSTGKKIILDDGLSNTQSPAQPFSFTNPRNPDSGPNIEYAGNKIIIVDSLGNRLVIDSSKRAAELFAKNGVQVHSEGGLVSLKAENPKALGEVEVGNHSTGNTKLYALGGDTQILAKTKATFGSAITPGNSPMPGMVASTGFRPFKLLPVIPDLNPSLSLGIGLPNPIDFDTPLFPSTSYQSFSLTGIDFLSPTMTFTTPLATFTGAIACAGITTTVPITSTVPLDIISPGAVTPNTIPVQVNPITGTGVATVQVANGLTVNGRPVIVL